VIIAPTDRGGQRLGAGLSWNHVKHRYFFEKPVADRQVIRVADVTSEGEVRGTMGRGGTAI